MIGKASFLYPRKAGGRRAPVSVCLGILPKAGFKMPFYAALPGCIQKIGRALKGKNEAGMGACVYRFLSR
jgi:hypothetical protein